MTKCPTCGKLVMDEHDPPVPPEQQCSPIRSPGCWKVIGKSKNGGPLLRLVEADG